MAFKRSAVRSRLSPPKKHRFYLESVLFSNFFRFSVLLGQRKSQQNQPFLPFVPSKGGRNGLHSGKVKREEDCFLQIQGLRGSGRQWQADFQVYDLVFSKKFFSHLVGSENAILSGSDTKLFHFCMVKQNSSATFVNSSNQRTVRMDCTGSQFAVYCR